MDRTFAVVLRNAEEARAACSSLVEAFGDANVVGIISNSLVMVDTDAAAREIMEEAGLNQDRAGIVLEMGGGYAGYMPSRFWEWLREHK